MLCCHSLEFPQPAHSIAAYRSVAHRHIFHVTRRPTPPSTLYTPSFFGDPGGERAPHSSGVSGSSDARGSGAPLPRHVVQDATRRGRISQTAITMHGKRLPWRDGPSIQCNGRASIRASGSDKCTQGYPAASTVPEFYTTMTESHLTHVRVVSTCR